MRLRVLSFISLALSMGYVMGGIGADLPASADNSEIIGDVVAVSSLPDPKTSDYPDCDFTVKVKVSGIINGPGIPSDIILIVPGFIGRTRCEYPIAIVPGARIRARIVPKDGVSSERAMRQRADSIMDFLLDEYFLTEQLPVSDTGTAAVRSPSQSEKSSDSGTDVILPAPSAEAEAERAELIRDDLKNVIQSLESRKIKGPPQPEYPDEIERLAKASKGFWHRDTMVKAVTPRSDDFGDYDASVNGTMLEALTLLNEECRKRNIDLIVLSLPYEFELYAPWCAESGLEGEDSFSAYRLNLVRAALERDIEIIDLREPLMEALPDSRQLTGVNHMDHHWDTDAVRLTAGILAKRLSRYDWSAYPRVAPGDLVERPVSQIDYLPGNERYTGKYTTTGFLLNGRQDFLFAAEDSPILIIGDSFAVRPQSGSACGSLGAFLTRDLGILPYVSNQLGSTRVIFSLQKDRFRILSGRRVCILVYSPLYGGAYWYYYNRELEEKVAKADRILAMDAPFNFDGEKVASTLPNGAVSSSGQEVKFEFPLPDEAQKYKTFYVEMVFNTEPMTRADLTVAGKTLHKVELDGRYIVVVSQKQLQMSRNVLSINVRNMMEKAQAVIKEINVYGDLEDNSVGTK